MLRVICFTAVSHVDRNVIIFLKTYIPGYIKTNVNSSNPTVISWKLEICCTSVYTLVLGARFQCIPLLAVLVVDPCRLRYLVSIAECKGS
jgi:hypothetical protein